MEKDEVEHLVLSILRWVVENKPQKYQGKWIMPDTHAFAYDDKGIVEVVLKETGQTVVSELTAKERELLAFSVFSMGMKIGPPSFEILESIVKKVGIEKEFEEKAKSWIDYSKQHPAKEP